MVVVGMKYIASISFGKDSLAMLLRLLEENLPLDMAVFYNTGMEFDAIYRIRDEVKPLLAQHGVEFVELQPAEPFLYSMLERKVVSKQKGEHLGYGWCGGLCRWGTAEKTRAIKRFKQSLGVETIDYVGIAADETQRFDKEWSEARRLPLVDWGMTEADCLQYCYAHGFRWMEESLKADGGQIDLYEILDRVSCWCCTNKNLKELRNIYIYLPQYWEKLKKLQMKIDRPYKGFYKGEPRGVFELELRFLDKLGGGGHVCKF